MRPGRWEPIGTGGRGAPSPLVENPMRIESLWRWLGLAGLLLVAFGEAGSVRRCYIGTHNYRAGMAVGKLVTEACPQGGKIVIFVGKLDVQNAIERRQGVLDYLTDPNPERLKTGELGEIAARDATNLK